MNTELIQERGGEELIGLRAPFLDSFLGYYLVPLIWSGVYFALSRSLLDVF